MLTATEVKDSRRQRGIVRGCESEFRCWQNEGGTDMSSLKVSLSDDLVKLSTRLNCKLTFVCFSF